MYVPGTIKPLRLIEILFNNTEQVDVNTFYLKLYAEISLTKSSKRSLVDMTKSVSLRDVARLVII